MGYDCHYCKQGGFQEEEYHFFQKPEYFDPETGKPVCKACAEMEAVSKAKDK